MVLHFVRRYKKNGLDINIIIIQIRKNSFNELFVYAKKKASRNRLFCKALLKTI